MQINSTKLTPKNNDIHAFNVAQNTFYFDADSAQISANKDSNFINDLAKNRFLNIQPTRAISLAVAQSCNFSCSYCYAEGGQFGQRAQLMDKTVAFAAIEQLIEATPKGERVTIAYMGGEPMLNHKLIHKATRYAFSKGLLHGVKVGFSITTNGSLISEKDIQLFREYGFSITISIDGSEEQHNQQRPLVSGKSSYQTVIKNIQPLLDNTKGIYLTARVTVTPNNLDLNEAFKSLRRLGFKSIGFSPMINAPKQKGELNKVNLEDYLEQMIGCAEGAIQQIELGEQPEFANFTTALKEIHSGKTKAHPCGAGNGYVGIGANAKMYLCHRYINDERGEVGDVLTGINKQTQINFVKKNDVNNLISCRSCWARRLCGGGCYHEVANRGRPTCQFIRGWLDYCLKAYIKIRISNPEYFRSIPTTDRISIS